MSSRLPFLIIVVLSFAQLASTPSAAPDPAAIARSAEAAIERAAARGDAPALAAAMLELDAALAAHASDPALLYVRAYADYQSAGLRRAPGERAERERSLNAAVLRLPQVKGAPWEAEAWAMESAILGEMIGLSSDPATAGAELGPKSMELLDRAMKAAPESPRLLLFEGRALLFTPPEYGGDPGRGASLLQHAVQRFGAAPDASGPQWGHVEALVWLGVARQRTGDPAGARAAWQQALAIEPDHRWVKFGLLPSLDAGQAKP
jgi:hypothetical protein